MAIENTHYGAERIGEMLKNCRRIHFIGIGGINMSSLAHITAKRGYEVSGSDRTDTPLTRRIEAEGIRVSHIHDRSLVEEVDAVVYTVAISADNPEYVGALERGIPCISRADYLGYLMTAYETRIGVSGMHGKSSCTSMIAETLIRGGADPTVLSGAELSIMGGAYCVGESQRFVFEACEYMDSFLDFCPTVAIVLNIEMDHVDYFKSMEQIRSSYARFAALTGEDGCAILNADDPEVIAALADYRGERITFSTKDGKCDYVAKNITVYRGRSSFDLIEKGSLLCRATLGVTGAHHVYNALAAAAACRRCGLSADAIREGLVHFGGAKRRMEFKGSLNGAEIYDDYGHHPTEIRATLGGAKGICEENGRLFCVYQPHTYSRTAALLDDFSAAFGSADRVILAPIYAARETDTLGVSSKLLAERVGSKACYLPTLEEIADLLRRELTIGDTLVVMGAGDIYKLFDLLNADHVKGSL